MRSLLHVFCLCLIGLLSAAALPAQAQDPSPAETEESHATDDHSEAGHNEHDLTHANAGDQLESPAEFQADLAIWTFVVFVVLLIVLGKFAWGPITHALDERERVIADSIASAERLHAEAAAKLTDYEKQIQGAKDEVRELLERGRREAEAQGQTIVANAQAAAARESERARAEIEAAKNQALGELAQKSVDTAVSLAGQIVRRSITPADHAQLIQDAVEQFPSRN